MIARGGLAAGLRGAGAWIADRVFGVEPTNRRFSRWGLLSGTVYAAALFGEALALHFGLCDPVEVAWLSVYLLLGPTVFYVVIRSGLNRRLRDPSMTTAQIVFPISALLVAYPVDGPYRGLNLFCVALPPLFGFLTLGRREGTTIVAGVTLLFGSTMFAMARLNPARFDPRVEAVHFAILTTCMAALGTLLWQIATKRERARRQKLELSLALERIEAISTRDELTGLYNRRHMTARLEDEAARRARGGAPFCVCLIDIDHFKAINDTHGHARGDAVLRRFGQVLAAGLRETDVLARWGGEEFLLLLPATVSTAGIDRVEALRRHGAELAEWGDEASLCVRFSAGLAEDAGGTVSQTLDRADSALYRAKAAGRDRIVAATEPQAA